MKKNALFCFFVLLLVSGSSLLHAQPKTKRDVTREFFPGTQQLKTLTEVKITRNMHGDLFNYYKKTTVRRTEFTINGKPVKKTRRITKLGRSGKPCYELFSKEILYNENGQRKRLEQYKCDKNTSLIKEYRDGKVVAVRKLKKRRVWSGFWFFA